MRHMVNIFLNFQYTYRASFIILYYGQQMQMRNYFKLSHSYMFRHYRVILRETVTVLQTAAFEILV